MPPQAELAPYIGSRPYERTEADQRRFFGREREIEELVGLVLAHSVVLVYAASGAGKTSLFEAGVFPKLVEEGFEVLPRARVLADLPPGAVLERDTNPYVLSLLCWLSPSANAASLQHRTIAEHLSELPRPDNTTGRVMVIDQAEELFTFTPPDWQRHQKAFFDQLRDALRTVPDLRLVLITREDYLAQFDDLAPRLPGGLRVRFHLEPLGRTAARQAVEGPLASVGTPRTFDEGVADQLVEDLSRVKLAKEAGGDPRGVPGPYVEPVQLQIVCDALWSKLPGDVKLITAEHLQHYGDVEETLERFYEDTIEACVRAIGCDKERLARWFGDKLITPSATRRPVFCGPEEAEGIPNQVVAFLEKARLIHRDERANGCWGELAHDRLIRPVRVVNERWKVDFDVARVRQQRRRFVRRIALIGGPIFATILVASNIFSNLWARAQQKFESRVELKNELERDLASQLESARKAERERALTEERVEALRKRCSLRTDACDAETVRVFDSVTDYYWRQAKTEKLVALLKSAASLIPKDYGMPTPSSIRSGQHEDEPGLLQIEYNPARGVDEGRMRDTWVQIASGLGSRWGLPVLPRITLVPDIRVPVASVRVTASPESCAQPPMREVLSSSVQMPRQEAVVSEQEIRKDKRLREFFEQYSRTEGWTKYAALQFGGPWWFVPSWTLPIWRVAGHPAVSPEEMLAVVVANEVSNRPDLVLGCDALKILLQHANQVAPVSVREALAARTLEGLRRDLIEVVRVHRWSLRPLPTLLDALANHPDVATPDAARFAVQEQSQLDGSDLPPHGPWRVPLSFDEAKLAPTGRYKDLADEFPPIEQPIRVALGPTVMPAMVDAGALRDEILEQLNGLRRNLYLRYGIVAPGVRFRDTSDWKGLRIEVLNQDDGSPDAQPIEVSLQEAPERLSQELEMRYRVLRGWWLTADTFSSSLANLPRGERAWLDGHYSLTDLKQLARTVVGGDEDKDGADTLRDLPWLLSSLAFWSHVYPSNATMATVATALRETQRARLRPSDLTKRGDVDRGTAEVRRGLDAIGADRFGEAETHFISAIAAGRDAAIAAFLQMYPASSSLEPSRRSQWLSAQCRLPSRDAWSTPTKLTEYEAQDVLSRGEPITASARWKLELCILWSVVAAKDRPQEVERLTSALVADAPVESWTKEEAFFLARYWLQSHRAEAAPQSSEVSKIEQLLVRGLADLPTQKMVDSVWTTLQASLGSRSWHWRRHLLVEVARALPAGWPSLKLELANWLADFSEADAIQALALVDAIDPGRTVNETWPRGLVRANILERLGEYGGPAERAQRLDEAAQAFRALADNPPTPQAAGRAFTELANIYTNQGDIARARKAIHDGSEKSKNRGLFDVQEFFIELGEGNTRRAGEIATERLRRAPDDVWTPFVDAIFATLTRPADFEDAARNFIFGNTEHPYKDYVRFLLFWALSQEGRTPDAKQLIDERMREIHRETWKQRLAQGDTMVWREMLVVYFAGELPESAIFEPLRSDASFRSTGLGQTELSLNGLRCEASFYTALREHVTGDPATRDVRFRKRLNNVIDLKELGYFEHRMARFLLRQIGS